MKDHFDETFDGEQVMVDVLNGEPDPPNISEAERRYRAAIRRETKEAEREFRRLAKKGIATPIDPQ